MTHNPKANPPADGGWTGDDLEMVGNLIVPKASTKGIQVEPAAPTWTWKDLLGIPEPSTGAGKPTLEVLRGGMFEAFAYTTGDNVNFLYHLPHDYKMGTDLYLHIHWPHNGTSISGTLAVDWGITYAKGHNQAIFPAEVTLAQSISTPDIATIPQWSHRLDEIQLSDPTPSGGQIDTDDMEPDTLLCVNMEINTLPTIAGGATSKVFIFHADLHYQSTCVGTKQNAPDFYT